MTTLNLQFSINDLDFAQRFLDVSKLWASSKAYIDSVEQNNDSIIMGAFTITKLAVTKDLTSLLGINQVPIVDYIISYEKQTYSYEDGPDSCMIECGREKSFAEALKTCAKTELDWRLDNIIEELCVREDLEIDEEKICLMNQGL